MMNPDEALKRSLSAWKVEVEIPPRFQAGVWQRISAQEVPQTESFWSRLNQWISLELCTPSRAALLLVTCLALSVGTAYLRAQNSNNRDWQELQTRYLDSINPLVHESRSI